MMYRSPMLLCLMLSAAFRAGAQDKLYIKTQHAPVECEVTEVGTCQIKYHLTGRPVPVIVIDKEDVVKVVYGNGQEQLFVDPSNDFTSYSGQQHWNAKVNLISPLMGSTQLVLEHALKPGRSSEFELNLIGLGKSPRMNVDVFSARYGTLSLDPCGLGIGYGMKFIRPDHTNGRARLRHVLQGSYLRPGISAAYYQRNALTAQNAGIGYNYTTRRVPVYSACLSMTVGRQWVLNNALSIDLYGMVGLAADNIPHSQRRAASDVAATSVFYNDQAPFNGFGYTRFSRTNSNLGFGMGCGLRVGYAINGKKKKDSTAAKKRKPATPSAHKF